MNKKTLYTLSEASVMIALAIVLSFVEIQLGASGGSINFTMLPILIIAFRHGSVWGVGSGMLFGLIKCIIGSGLGWGLPSILLDYVLAYGAVGTAGLLRNIKYSLFFGSLLGCTLRYAIHFISGIVLYAITVPTEIETVNMVFSNAWAYSAVYNLVYMVPSSIVCIALACALKKPLEQMKKMTDR